MSSIIGKHFYIIYYIEQITFIFVYESYLIRIRHFYFFLRFYSFIHNNHRKRERERERERERQREKQTPCREPDVGLDPRAPGSCPGPKAGAKPLSHPGIPNLFFLIT